MGMTRHVPVLPDGFRVAWPIGLSLVLVIAVSLVDRAIGPLVFPFNLVLDIALLGVLAIGCLGSASRLYHLVWVRNATASQTA